MSRIRYLKPEFFVDEDLKNLPYEARIFFAGLWCHADKAGRLEDRPERLKVQIMPYDDIDPKKILNSLASSKTTGRPYIVRYVVDGNKYIQILKWNEHQKPHNTEKESVIPEFNGCLTVKEPLNNRGRPSAHSPSPLSSPLSFKALSKKHKKIIKDLNTVLNTNYKYTSKNTINLINARLKEGFKPDDFKTVHRKMLRLWGADQKMCKYLRPETLYAQSKFEGYLNMKQPQTKLTEAGVRAYLVGQSWLEKEIIKEKNNAA